MPDHVRESVFNLLRGHTEDQPVVDVFAGTGSVGLEALSRGAGRCVFIERDRAVARTLRENIASFGVGDRAEVVTADAMGGAALAATPLPVHLIFFDPPYSLIINNDDRARTLAQFARFVARLDPDGYAVLRTPWPVVDEHLHRIDPYNGLAVPDADGPETHPYGSTAVHLYMRRPAAADAALRDAD